jgi:membrane-bound metal-dependent hydrolase YbcI (DUF457 family)
MPITPYHFGPSGFFGLLFKRWLDLPIFVLANVVVDLEVATVVLLHLGRPLHRYAHTLLGGAVVGIVWGLLALPLRPLFARLMHLLHLPYQTSLAKAVLSGILGVWLHVIIDATYHRDVRLAWPTNALALWRITSRHFPESRVEDLCVLFFPATVILYLILMARWQRRERDARQ